MRLKEVIRENKISLLIAGCTAGLAYWLLSIAFPPWKLSGQLITPLLAMIMYTLLKYAQKAKEEKDGQEKS